MGMTACPAIAGGIGANKSAAEARIKCHRKQRQEKELPSRTAAAPLGVSSEVERMPVSLIS